MAQRSIQSRRSTKNAAALLRSFSTAANIDSPLNYRSLSISFSLLCYANMPRRVSIFFSTYLLNSLFCLMKHLLRSLSERSFCRLECVFDLIVCFTTFTIGINSFLNFNAYQGSDDTLHVFSWICNVIGYRVSVF